MQSHFEHPPLRSLMSAPSRWLCKVIGGSETAPAPVAQLPLFESLKNVEHQFGYIPLSPKESRIKSKKPRTVLKILILSFASAFTIFYGPSILYYTTLGYNALLPNYKLHQQDCSPKFEPKFVAAPAKGKLLGAIERAKWVPSCSSNQTNHECKLAIDADPKTYWQTANGAAKPDVGGHWIQIDLSQNYNVHSIAMTPLGTAEEGGAVSKHVVQISKDGVDWHSVAFGTWYFDDEVKYATFEPREAQFLRLVAIESTNNAKSVAIGDISVFVVDTIPANVPNGGVWGLTLDFPLVPVGVFVNPKSGDVVTFSSFKHNKFQKDKTNGTTFTATWNRQTGQITDKQIEDTKHDMFCPGMSFDDTGRMIITGGSTAQNTSIYNSENGIWSKGEQLNIGRGYQGQTFVPNGKTFVIGGSWAGSGEGNKVGEIYDPTITPTRWRTLEGCPAPEIEMSSDPDGESRWDYHVWMFGWKQNSIFHAGPAKTLHWITTSQPGNIQVAGTREAGDLADGDAVCGITSMYDAEKGLILTAGGAPQYHIRQNGQPAPWRKPATNNAFIIKLGDPGVNVTVSKTDQMKFQRAFANGVTLPNGETFVVGGQREGEPFYEETWHEVPEIYSPEKGTWRNAAHHSTPRVYHSFALLLPDATVLVGGGGLDRAETNHFDAQIYYPPYLWDENAKRIPKRPEIKTDITESVKVGETLTIMTDSAVDGASLVRYSGATHSLNNDQRRIKLQPVKVNGADFKYTVTIPPDTGVALPGYWMLFVFANGVPSKSKPVRIRLS